MTTSLHSYTDIDGLKLVFTYDQDRFINLVTKNFRLYELNGRAVDTDETLALTGLSNRSCSL
jgi:hypothetical protein